MRPPGRKGEVSRDRLGDRAVVAALERVGVRLSSDEDLDLLRIEGDRRGTLKDRNALHFPCVTRHIRPLHRNTV
jgi:hypothetical protein